MASAFEVEGTPRYTLEVSHKGLLDEHEAELARLRYEERLTVQKIAQKISEALKRKIDVGIVKRDLSGLKEEVASLLGQLTPEEITAIITSLKAPKEDDST